MHIKDIKNKLKVLKKRAQGSVGTAIKVLTSVVLGAAVMIGSYGLVSEVVLPLTNERVESMFSYSSGAEGDVGGSGTVEPTPSVGKHEIIDGANQVFDTTGAELLSLRSSAPLNEFQEVQVNGVTVPEENYTLTEGSTIVTFTEEYGAALNAGVHEIAIVSDSGAASADVYVINGILSLDSDAVIPEGATYTQGDVTYIEGQTMPTPAVGDKFNDGDYQYVYRSSDYEGWQVTVLDKTKTEYGQIYTTINGVNVVYMGGTFQGCASLLTAPVIPNTVTNLTSTFSGCTVLTKVPALPDSVTNLYSTFYNCASLTEISVLPDNVDTMIQTFYGCTALTEAPAIPDTVTCLAKTFYKCTSLTKAPVIPDGVTKIESIFNKCTALTTAPTIPSSVKDMSSAFSGCTSLAVAPTIPYGVEAMDSAFSGCTSLIEAPVIPSSVKTIDMAFRNCTALTTAPVISDGVEDISSAFSGCTSLVTAPVIPSSVTNVQSAFYNCTALAGTIEVNANPSSMYFTNCLKNTQITEVIGSCSQETKDKLMNTR